jgi:hypothetical protein
MRRRRIERTGRDQPAEIPVRRQELADVDGPVAPGDVRDDAIDIGRLAVA